MGGRPPPLRRLPANTQFSSFLCFSPKEPPTRTPTVLSSVPMVSPRAHPSEDFSSYPCTVAALPLPSRHPQSLGAEDPVAEN